MTDAAIDHVDRRADSYEAARRRFGQAADYVQADLRQPLPVGRSWDGVVSALAIHHLSDPAKRELFGRVHAALSPGGLFINAEQVAGPTALFDRAYEEWHERHAKALGTSDAAWTQALESMSHDRAASVEHQLGWLREAGFADADCLFKDHRLAVLVARRPADAPDPLLTRDRRPPACAPERK